MKLTDINWATILELAVTLIILLTLVTKLIILQQSIDVSALSTMFR